MAAKGAYTFISADEPARSRIASPAELALWPKWHKEWHGVADGYVFSAPRTYFELRENTQYDLMVLLGYKFRTHNGATLRIPQRHPAVEVSKIESKWSEDGEVKTSTIVFVTPPEEHMRKLLARNLGNVAEWRPHLHPIFPPKCRNTLQTLLLLAKLGVR